MRNYSHYKDKKLMVFLLAIFMSIAGCLQMQARDPVFLDKDNYTAYITGYNKVHFKLPLYDCNMRDRWANKICVKANGQEVLEYYTKSDEYQKCYVTNKGVGNLQIWTTNGFREASIYESCYEVPTPVYKATDNSFVEFDWCAPTDWSGDCQITVEGQYYWWFGQYKIGTKEEVKDNTPGVITLLNANFTKSEKPEIASIVPSFTAERAGYMTAYWYVPAKEIKSGSWGENGELNNSINGTDANGEIYLNAFVPHKNLRVKTTYTLPNGQDATVTSSGVDAKIIHTPKELKATAGRDANDNFSMVLSWKVNYPEESDYYDNDLWEIQRNTSGDKNIEDQWKTIGTVEYEDNKSDEPYTFKDSTYAENFAGKFPVYYRIRRVNTSLWGWGENSGAATTDAYVTPLFNNISGFQSIRVNKDGKSYSDIVKAQGNSENIDEEQFDRVKLTWNVDDMGVVHTAWNKNMKLKLTTRYYNDQKDLMGSNSIELEDDIKKAKCTYVELNKPCITYDFSLEQLVTGGSVKIGKDQKDSIILNDVKAGENELEKTYKISQTGTPANLKSENRHTYIHLSWEQGKYDCDYFRIYRKLHEETEYKLLKDNVATLFYDDKATRPCDTYDYYVEGVTLCEGIKTAKTEPVVGSIDKTGTIKGYVRMPDGTGIAGAKVTASPVGNIVGATSKTVVTDSVGFFSISDLVYQSAENMEGSYSLVVESTDGASYISNLNKAMFNKNVNNVDGVIFTLSKSYKFTGAVYYEGSSIPVMGASFKVDGQPVYSNNGKLLTTDNSGEFTIHVTPGSHSVQVFKENHQFADNGMLIDLDAADGNTQRHNFQGDLKGYYFWDQTKIHVKGRIAGGDIEGSKPLGEWKSKNILGDNLEMELQLDGDNSSYIFRDNNNTSLTQKVENLSKTVDGVDHKWSITRERHRIVIHPDSITGEFELDLYPVKWKMSQASCNGYVSLIQSGKVGETYDFTDSISTAEINHIYHSKVDFAVTQLGSNSKFPFFGQLKYDCMDVMGRKYPVLLAYEQNGNTKYTFDYPVFMENYAYIFSIKAGEYYYYNNKKNTVPTIVPIQNASINIHNQLVQDDEGTVLELDSLGSTNYTFQPNNLVFASKQEDAIRSISFTLEYNGAHYDSEPIRAYLMGAKATSQGTRYIAAETPVLFDILRDPPGTNSSATLKKGSSLSCSFNYEVTGKAGLSIGISSSAGATSYIGTFFGADAGGVIGGNSTGSVTTVNKSTSYNLDFCAEGGFKPNYTYEYSVEEDISTSSTLIGSIADIYMGFNNQIVASEANAVRVIPKYVYDRLPKGYAYVIANATIPAKAMNAEQDSICYLVRDKVMGFNQAAGSFFYYTQKYIEQQLLPDLYNRRTQLLIPASSGKSYAQSVAESTQQPVYLSLVPEDDADFGAYDKNGQKNWEMILPKNWTGSMADEVEKINETATAWVRFLAANEKEKLNANKLVKRFDFDGSSSISYSETFNNDYSDTRYIHWPFGGNSDGDLLAMGKAVGSFFSMIKNKQSSSGSNNSSTKVEVNTSGGGFELSLDPVLEFNYDWDLGKSESHSKTIEFSFDINSMSNLTVDVYRVEDDITKDSLQVLQEKGELYTSFNKSLFDKISSGNTLNASLLGNIDNMTQYGSYVFRTRGGMTRDPWEEGEVTKYYMPGTPLFEPTVQIDRLHIWVDKQEISNVPMGEPARFTVHMRNDSDYPKRAGKYFSLSTRLDQNLQGAKMMCEGAPLVNSIDLEINPGQTISKVIEVYPSESYDYDNLGLWFYSEGDTAHCATLQLAAHFVPSAGSVNISTPGNKWVLNTFSQYDQDRADHYLPVRIDGFDTNFRGFDHIELQYKKSTEGDNNWVSICSYYADEEKMKLAGGTKRLIGKEGYITERFYGDKGSVEQQYDLRAVEYCSYGSGFLTKASDVLTGIKDTRYPMPFGTPQPQTGILGIGDNIRIPFSENIDANSLSKLNNFQVMGRTNNSNIALSTSLLFKDNFLTTSEFERNLTGKDFSIDVMLNPTFTGKDMCFFTHGNNSSYLNLYITADKHLKMIMKTSEVLDSITSKEAIDFNGMHQVAMTYDNTTGIATLYDGNKEIGQKEIDGEYMGQGQLVMGANSLMSDYLYKWVAPKDYYNGNMLEFRLWNRVLEPSDLSAYSRVNLTGYEYGLLDNYPMNEGSGSICQDKGPGKNNLILGDTGEHFTIPCGISLGLSKGIDINGRPFQINEHEDFTLMMWVNTTEENGVFLSNGEALKESGKTNHINIGIKDGKMYYRHGGKELANLGNINDGGWHHIAITENNVRNVGNIYIDGNLKETFTVDTIGGISYNNMMLGGCRMADGSVDGNLQCNIDELGLFNMVLPESSIKRFKSQTPNGQEMGLKAWLSCSQYERQSNNTMRVMPSGVSLKLYKADGIIQQQRDTIIAANVMEQIADRTTYAQMKENEASENIDFSYLVKDNELVINLGESDEKLERTNVYVTVKEVADLHGNLLQSPVAMDLYVYRAPLRWTVKQQKVTSRYQEGASFAVDIENVSGKSRDFEIKGLPIWLTASKLSGNLAALGEETITFSINKNTNIGNYDEQLYLCDADGINEPLPLRVSVVGDAPQWTVSDAYKHGVSMQMVARVKKQGNVMHDTNDILAVCDTLGKFMGVCHISVDNSNNANEALAYLTLTTNQQYNPKASNPYETPLNFWFFDSSTGSIYMAYPKDDISFQPNQTLGSPANPVELDIETYAQVQPIKLEKGWNWVSFYVDPSTDPNNWSVAPINVAKFLDKSGHWEAGDAFSYVERRGKRVATRALVYTTEQVAPGKTLSFWTNDNAKAKINGLSKYEVYVTNPKTIYVQGLRNNGSITIRSGWNRIGYNMDMNLSLESAMADYMDKALDGDVLKSRDAFAMVCIDIDGNKTWKGNLQYMTSGQGYMLKRNTTEAADSVTFTYPQLTGTFSNNSTVSTQAARIYGRNNMNIVAQAADIDVEKGDTLIALYDGEVCGMAVSDGDGRFYMTVGDEAFCDGSSDNTLDFAILRDGEVVAVSNTHVTFQADQVLGTPATPTSIHFGTADRTDDGKWYDTKGIRYRHRPQQPGVYIHNGKKYAF